ncbi:MAG: glycosyltransferase family 9 protein [Chlorobi bacterium]|nr:glycosyltransferase family 9 protein [Chlorobiota bacterium]
MKKILIIRFSSIGDIVLTSPVARAIKEQSDFEIHALTKKRYHYLYKNNPRISKTIGFSKSVTEVLDELKKEKYDFIVDLQKNVRSVKLVKSLKVPHSSFPKLNIEKWLLVNLHINKLPEKHIVERYFEAVKPLNIENDNKGLEYYLPHNFNTKPTSINKGLSKGYIAFIIGGQHSTKIMPAVKVASIASQLSLPVILIGGPEDKKRGEEVVKSATSNLIINCCGQYSINASASLVKQAKLVITNDTGLMHVGAAFKRPIISLWGNTIPEFGMYPYFPQQRAQYVISEVSGLKCRPCSKIGFDKCPKGHFKCMLDQDERFIIKSSLMLLQ